MGYTFNVKQKEEKKVTQNRTSKKFEFKVSIGWQEYGGISPWECVKALMHIFWSKYTLCVIWTLRQEYNSKGSGLLVTSGSCQKQMHIFLDEESNFNLGAKEFPQRNFQGKGAVHSQN